MEELETVSFLQPDMSLPILSAFYKDNKYFEKKNVGVHHHLMVTGGSQGILKFFSVYLKVCVLNFFIFYYQTILKEMKNFCTGH